MAYIYKFTIVKSMNNMYTASR